LGVLLASATFPTTAAGYRDLAAWARTFGTLWRAGVECTGSYGAALTRHLRSQGIDVIEVNQPDKATRRRRGKTRHHRRRGRRSGGALRPGHREGQDR